jgi:phosphopantothenoylcysteine synthetase/decarboxylase
VLAAQGLLVVAPVVKQLACGDTGQGAMADVNDVAASAGEQLRQHAAAAARARAQGLPAFEL